MRHFRPAAQRRSPPVNSCCETNQHNVRRFGQINPRNNTTFVGN
jgi:hypothetical protein